MLYITGTASSLAPIFYIYIYIYIYIYVLLYIYMVRKFITSYNLTEAIGLPKNISMYKIFLSYCL